MTDSFYREKSMDRMTSPEELSGYLRVTSPAVWLVLTAVILLLAGMLLWGALVSIDSIAAGTAQVENGSMQIVFDDPQIAACVQPGMTVKVGETESRVSSIGLRPDGALFASASTSLPDGSYPASVILRQTQVLKLLFN